MFNIVEKYLKWLTDFCPLGEKSRTFKVEWTNFIYRVQRRQNEENKHNCYNINFDKIMFSLIFHVTYN